MNKRREPKGIGSPDRDREAREGMERLLAERERVARVLEAAADALVFPDQAERVQSTELLLGRTAARLRSLLPLEEVGFYLLAEDGMDIALAFSDPAGSASRFEGEMAPLVEDGTVAWTLAHNHPVFAAPSDGEGSLFLHALATPARTLGFCMGALSTPPEELPEVALAFGTVILGQAAGTLEDARLYATIRTLNEDLSAKLAALEETRSALEKANRFKDLFVANTGHELRTPIAALMGAGRLLKDSSLDPEQEEYVRLILLEGGTALRILSDLLDLSKIEAGRFSIVEVPFEPAGVAMDVKNRFSAAAAERGLELRTLLDTRLPDVVMGDSGRIRQILSNLVENGIKFTPEGWVALEVARHRSALVWSVRDSGPGIVREDADRLFQPFVQGRESVGGSGLGLALSRRLAELMGGALELESSPGRGSCFRLTLPLSLPSDAAGSSLPPPPEEGFSGGFSALRILVAEDNSTQRLVTTGFLRRSGALPVPAPDGREAARLLGSEEFDAALLDIRMPFRTGVELVRSLRAGELGRPDLPVVAMTAGVMEEELEEARRAGFDSVLPKPFSPEDLARAVARAVARSLTRSRPQGEGREFRGAEERCPPFPVPPSVPTAAAETPPPALSTGESAGRAEMSPPGGDASPSGADVPGSGAGTHSRFPLPPELLRRAGGDEALARQVLASLEEDLESAEPELETAAGGGDRERVAFLSHSLAGAAGAAGAEDLTRSVRSLESAAREGEDLAVPLERFRRSCESWRDDFFPAGKRRKAAVVVEEQRAAADLTEGTGVSDGLRVGEHPGLVFPEETFRGMKILIAEDNGTSRKLLAGFLAGRGYSVIEAADGNEALGILLGEDPPSLAVVDWLMPGLSGSELCRRIRALRDRRAYQYLILLTVRREREWILEGLRSGADDYIVKPFDPEELELRIAAGRRVLSMQEALMHAASHDALTGVLNRGALIEREEAELARSRREGAPLSVLMIDLDHFKEINDLHGHLVGDGVLREAVGRINETLRGYDFLGRYGGEEFLAVLPGDRSEDALKVAERIRAAVSTSPVFLLGRDVSVTISIGVAPYEGTGSVDDLNRAADEALYRAKKAGRNRVGL